MTIGLFSNNIDCLDYWSSIITNHKKFDRFDIDKIEFYDTIIVDFSMFDNTEHLITSIMYIKQKHAKVIVLHNKPEFQIVKKLLKHKISGYGNIMMDKTHILSAIKMANEDKIWLYPEFVSQLIMLVDNDLDTLDEKLEILTLREKDVAKLITKGCSNKDISEYLNISLNTVKVHLSKIFQKLNVKDRFGLTVLLK